MKLITSQGGRLLTLGEMPGAEESPAAASSQVPSFSTGLLALDALAPGARLVDTPGTAGGVRSLSIGLYPPRTSIAGDAGGLGGHHAYVVGVATRGDIEIPFEGGLDIEAEGNKREVAGIPLTAELDDGVPVTIELHLEAWFDEAHFDRLTEKSPRGRFLITRSTQVGAAWFIGARSAAAFSASGSPVAEQERESL